MDRRTFLATLAAGTAGVLTGCSSNAAAPPHQSAQRHLAPPPPRPPLQGALPTTRAPRPDTTITKLPGPGRALALTVDDGANSSVVAAYCQFAKDTGARFTFFVTGQYDSWRENRAALRPLVESGQVQLGNHTWSHPDLTSLTARECAEELRRTKRFLRSEYGIDGVPYYRPPYGFHNDQVDKVAADLGYPVPTLWYGSLSDSSVVTEKFLIGAARKYFQPQRIVIGHANHDPVTHVYHHFTQIIRERRLQMVTLNDYFA
ncbi:MULTISPECIES: polysaccharide deacetylase family protein [Gordonia]|uniref:polysaccharide deacetylase family protein n=1 Tax=Gordonia TaxID=2053 RepID=UPI0025C18853|nr:polysaccharide deacetylase family protein [Gordonia sp. UBA5067]